MGHGSKAYTEYPKAFLSGRYGDDEIMITIDLAKNPENVITGAQATKRSVSLNCGWYTGSADVYCIPPEDLAASKLSACCTRDKPRDLYDLQVMREQLDMHDADIVDRFILNHMPSDWSLEASGAMSDFHKSKSFLNRVQDEMVGNFLPKDFNVNAASDGYYDLSRRVSVELGLRRSAGTLVNNPNQGRASAFRKVPGIQVSHSQAVSMAPSPMGRTCDRETPNGENPTCQNPHPGTGKKCAAGHKH